MMELCTAYFFIGHRGSIAKEDVRAAYDVSTVVVVVVLCRCIEY